MSRKIQIPTMEEMDKAKVSSRNWVPSHFKPGTSATSDTNSDRLATVSRSKPHSDPEPPLSQLSVNAIKTVASSSTSITRNSNGSATTSSMKPIPAPFTSAGTTVHSLSAEERSTARPTTVVPVSASPLIDSKALGTDILFESAEDQVEHPGLKAATDEKKSATNDNNVSGPSRSAKLNSIIVSNRQKGNPILKFVRRVPWEFGDIVPDYQIGPTSCVLYLSLKYHNLNPNYIHERLKQLANSFNLRVLLAQVDVKDPHHSLKELAVICVLADCTLILAFTPEEAGRYLETYKSFESKPPDLIMEKSESNYLAKMTDTLTSVTKVNKTDAVTLLSAFGSFAKLTEVSEEDLSLCPGLGPQKARRLHKVFNQPFIKDLKSTTTKPRTIAPFKQVETLPPT